MSVSKFLLMVSLSDFISFLALTISGISISWNIYRDLILKPKIRTRIQISKIFGSDKALGSYIDVTGINYGPGPITCESVLIKTSLRHRLKGKKKYGFIISDYANPLTDKLPKRLEVGEKITMLYRHKADAFLASEPARICFKDSFGRLHWASRKNLHQAIKDYLRDFPNGRR